MVGMSKIREFLAKRSLSDPARWTRKQHVFTLLREMPEDQRVYNRLANRYWMVVFKSAGGDYPYAILAEYDDERGCYDVVKEGEEQIDERTLDFWYDCERRVGDW
jgi:hypothetical protein